MGLVHQVLRALDISIIYPLFVTILTLILLKTITKNRFKITQALNLVRWIIIVYTLVGLVYFIFGFITNPDSMAFTNRATGPYKVMYWIVLFCALLLPFTLLFKKLASKPFYLLNIAILFKIGWFFERLVITVTSYHRNFVPNQFEVDFSWFPFFILFVLKGIAMAILLLIIAHYTFKNDNKAIINDNKPS